MGCGAGSDSQSRPADVLVPNWDLGKLAAFDLSVTSTLQSSALLEASVTAGSAALLAENRKHNNSDKKCDELGWACIPLVVETYGCWGAEAVAALSKLAGRLSVRNNELKSKTMFSLYSRLGLTLVRANCRAILSSHLGLLSIPFSPSAPYTIVTFPFLFAVMFGDAGHGLLMTLYAFTLLIFQKRLQGVKNEMFSMLFSGRYLLLLMEIFSIYTGLIYNDVFFKAAEHLWFQLAAILLWCQLLLCRDGKHDLSREHHVLRVILLEATTVRTSAATLDQTRGTWWCATVCGVPLEGPALVKEVCTLPTEAQLKNQPYPFGLDPVWAMADNELIFTNPYKVKMSIVLGVMQMLFGVILSVINYVKKANVTIKDGNMWLPLHYATWNGFLECVNATLHVPEHQGLTGLNLAIGLAQTSQLEEILAVLTEAFKERQMSVVRPILFDTCTSGEKDRLVEVLEEGDEVNPLNPNGEWPVLLAAATGQVEIIKCLHEFGGVVTYMADSISTPLHQASERGHIKVVEYLLQFYPRPHLHKVSEGKDINRRDSSRATALELAARNGHSEIVELLLAHGALSSLPDSKCHFVGSEQYAGVQHTLDSHRRMQFSKLSRALKSNITIDYFKLIWVGPSDFNLYTRSGSNVLMLAAHNTYAEIVTLLVQETKKLTPDMMMMSKIAMWRLPTPPLTTKRAHGSTTGSEDAVPTPRPLAKATPLPNEATPSHPPPKETAGSDSQASGDEHLTMSMFDDEMKRLKAELANKLAN
ncbi:hypothetical protein EMCRGX_G004105 [Ephydatia muelleri]